MNERIKELKDRARDYYLSQEDLEFPSSRELHEAVEQKFAELIVKECAEICLEANDHKNILRHFGVE